MLYHTGVWFQFAVQIPVYMEVVRRTRTLIAVNVSEELLEETVNKVMCFKTRHLIQT